MGARVARIGALFGDPVRAAMLTRLIDGRALPAGELAFVGNVTPQTASFHLGKLLETGLVVVERQGRHKYYRLANGEVALAIESVAAIAPLGRHSIQGLTNKILPAPGNKDLRFARSCYKHLAGSLAIEIHNAMLGCGLILQSESKKYGLTKEGARWLAQLSPSNHEMLSRREQTGRACLDWTERRHHVGGPLGVTLLSVFTEAGWLVKRSERRSLRLSLKGREGLERRLGLCFGSLS